MTKKVLIGLPQALLNKIDFAAQTECRTRSDLIREALRRYLDSFQLQHVLQANSASGVALLEETFRKSPPIDNWREAGSAD